MLEMLFSPKPTAVVSDWVTLIDLDFSTNGAIKDKITGKAFTLGTGVTVANGAATFTGSGSALLYEFGEVDFVGCEVEILISVSMNAQSGSNVFELGRVQDNTTSMYLQIPDGTNERFVNDQTTTVTSWTDIKWAKRTGSYTYKFERLIEKPNASWNVYRDTAQVGSMADLWTAGFYRERCSLCLGGLLRSGYFFSGSISKFSIRVKRKYEVVSVVVQPGGTYTPSVAGSSVFFVKGAGGGGGAGGKQDLSYKYRGGSGGIGGLVLTPITLNPVDTYTVSGGIGGLGGQNSGLVVNAGRDGSNTVVSKNGVGIMTGVTGKGGGGSATNQGADGANGGNGLGAYGGQGGYRANGKDGLNGNLTVRYVVG